jgi:hypothetical protein
MVRVYHKQNNRVHMQAGVGERAERTRKEQGKSKERARKEQGGRKGWRGGKVETHENLRWIA